MQRIFLILTLLAFSALGVMAIWQHGYLGLIDLRHLGSALVFADLSIMLVLAMIWLWHDARARGRNPWPWVLATPVLGAPAVLLYLIFRNAGRSQ